MFCRQNVAEAHYGKFLRYFKSLAEKYAGCSHRDQIVHCPDCRDLQRFIDHLQCGISAFFDGGSRCENKAIIAFDPPLAQRPPTSFQSPL